MATPPTREQKGLQYPAPFPQRFARILLHYLEKPENKFFRETYRGEYLELKRALQEDSSLVVPLEELVAVPSLRVTNFTTTGDLTELKVPFRKVVLQWDHLPVLSRTFYPFETRDAFGNITYVKETQGRKDPTYHVFEYVSSSPSLPSNPRPGIVEPNGDWYKVAETKDATCTLLLPDEAYVGFWVGFSTPGTESSVPMNSRDEGR